MSKQEVAEAVGTAVGTGRYVDTKDAGLFPEQFLTGQTTATEQPSFSPSFIQKVLQKYLNVTFKDGICQPLKKSALA